MFKSIRAIFFSLILLICSVTLSISGENSNENVPVNVNNSGFESLQQNNLPASWTFENAAAISMDNQSAKFGKTCLAVNHHDWQQSAIVSDPVKLRIGHLYKLSAWIKTENAVTDPIDQYPTSVAACLTMESFPFTNHSPVVGATRDWQKIEVEFIATKTTDRVNLHFGLNGKAKGKVWYDNVQLEKVEDISNYIPLETVKWFNDGYRYDDRGWIFVHIEGEPYQRGYQYGYLIAEEMVEYMNKLGIEINEKDPKRGWYDLRIVADAFMLRKYETEYLTEMKGIADGANKAGVKLFDRNLDLIDMVTMNSAIDIDAILSAMPRTAHQLSSQSFLNQEDELNIPDKQHKCSSFLANKSSTKDGRIVFAQLFMWGGYTGPHWNVVCDVVPSKGHRLVYETYPGGIHSGADFYINESGIMIGETTVFQTPFNPDGSPQSNRIRKAAQYAGSIDDVVKILKKDNNGAYTNDWLIADTKTNEIAVFLLGTKKSKLWRSTNNEFYGDTKDFYWCVNNNKDREVRKEYIPNKDNAPYDLIFTPWNRDIAFYEFYKEMKGKMDAIAAVNVVATEPINRPHACDGKVTTSEMAENLVFFIHSGKVTLRSKFVNENKRIPDLPGAVPRLSLGYSTVSPKFITEKLKSLRSSLKPVEKEMKEEMPSDGIIDKYSLNKRKLWFNTVYPASEAENWFISGTAAYWEILNDIPEKNEEILSYFQDQFAEMNCRYLYTTKREGSLAPVKAQRVYDRYNNYQVPRIKGTYLLHQLRLKMGNDLFSDLMIKVHQKHKEREMETDDFISMVNKVNKSDLKGFTQQWLERDDLPNPEISADVTEEGQKWKINLNISQPPNPYQFITTVMIVTDSNTVYEIIEVKDQKQSFSFFTDSKPVKLTFNALNDVLLDNEKYFTWSNFYDDFHHTIIVYGTKRQIEANHTLAQRFNTMLADRYVEKLMPVRKDSEISDEELKANDLIVIGNIEDNSLMEELATKLNLRFRKNMFAWDGKDFTRSDEGLYVTFPNPYNPAKAVHLYQTNSALQLYQMSKDRVRMPSWAIFKGDKIEEKGYHPNETFILELR